MGSVYLGNKRLGVNMENILVKDNSKIDVRKIGSHTSQRADYGRLFLNSEMMKRCGIEKGSLVLLKATKNKITIERLGNRVVEKIRSFVRAN